MGDAADRGFRDLVGLQVEHEGEGRARVRLDIEDRHLNPRGTVHGGVLATMADVAMGEAVAAGADSGEPGVTIELKVTYLNPGGRGEIVAAAHVIKRGSRVTIVETEVSQGDEGLIAHAIGTFTTT